MQYQPIECEAVVKIIGKKVCAFHARLGWSRTDWHTHNRGQLIYAEYGIMRLYTETDVLYIPSRHAAWIPQDVRHRVITESTDLVFRTLYLDCQGLTEPFYGRVSVFHLGSLVREMICYTEKWPLKGEATEQEATFLSAIKLLLPEQATRQVGMHLPTTELPLLRQLIEYLHQSLEEKLRAGAVARRFGLSERTMARLFLKELSMPFLQYLKLIRIIRALELLVQERKNISEAAYLVGYDSVPSFSNSFYEMVGVRPHFFLEHRI